jgi:dipeptidyl aminopeptidase/acylaminoacyl peptidase
MPDWERRYRAPRVELPAWARDRPDRLVHLSTESGSLQAWTWDLASGERRQVSDEPVGVTEAHPMPGGSGVAWFRDRSGDESGEYVVAPFEGGEARPLLEGLPRGWPGGLALGRTVSAVGLSDAAGFAIHAVAGSGETRELYRHPVYAELAGWGRGGVDLAALSADERLLCLAHVEQGDIVRPALRVLDPHSGESVGELWDGPGLGLSAAAWSPLPGDQRLAVVHEREGFGRPALWNPLTGERSDLQVAADGEVDVLDWWPDGSALLVVETYEGRSRLSRLELTGESEPIAHPEGTVRRARVRPDGAVWLEVASGVDPPRLLAAGGGQLVVPEGGVAPPGRPFLPRRTPNPAGEPVHGFLVKPAGEPPFPTVMWVHGGPTWMYADDWHPDFQTLVDRGFAVALPNYRGSTGYGVAWRDRLVGDIGFPELEDVLAWLDALVEDGTADPGRTVMAGWSWGGYLTLLMLGLHPERFAAGVAGVPVGDYAASHEDLSPPLKAYDRYLLGGTLQEKAELVRERSPITYADRVRAPVLCLIAEHDSRCPPRQAYAWVDAVRARGGDVEVYSYETGHSSYVVDEEVRQMRAVLDFLERELNGDRREEHA